MGRFVRKVFEYWYNHLDDASFFEVGFCVRESIVFGKYDIYLALSLWRHEITIGWFMSNATHGKGDK